MFNCELKLKDNSTMYIVGVERIEYEKVYIRFHKPTILHSIPQNQIEELHINGEIEEISKWK